MNRADWMTAGAALVGVIGIEVAAVRMRELGHVISVSVLAVPRTEEHVLDRVEDAVRRICELDWKRQDVVVAVVRELDDAPEDVLVRPG